MNNMKKSQRTLILLACLILLAGCGSSTEKGDISEKLASSGRLIPATEGMAFLSEVGEERSKGGYWLISYNVLDD